MSPYGTTAGYSGEDSRIIRLKAECLYWAIVHMPYNFILFMLWNPLVNWDQP